MEGQRTGGQTHVYRTVLVDDDPLFRGWLRSLLEASERFDVMAEAGDGGECLGLLDTLNPDVVVLDVNMPDRDGLELAGYISAHCPGVRTIVVSSHGAPVYSRLAALEGASAFIPKSDLSVSSLLQSLQAAPVP
ncbi:MAG: response regulator transcription factor [Dehalococcoidia bacterium]